MNKKYYISEHTFFHDLDYDKVWDWLFSYFDNLDIDEIIMVSPIYKSEIKIEKSLLSQSDFRGEKPLNLRNGMLNLTMYYD